MKKWLVYIHKNAITDEIFYVGIGSTIKRPYAKSNRSDRWQSYVRKYGSPIIEIIANDLSFSDAMAKEKELIAKYGRKKYEPNGKLINISIGGYGSEGVPCSEERKEYLRTKNSGVNNPRYGKTHTQEVREKIRQSRIGKKTPKSVIQKMLNTRKQNGNYDGFKLNEETKNKIRLKRIGVKASESTKEKMRYAIAVRGGSNMKGKRHTDEAKRKVSQANKGRLIGSLNPKAKKVIDTNTGIIYGSCKEACDILKLNYTYVKGQLNGFHKNLTSLKYI